MACLDLPHTAAPVVSRLRSTFDSGRTRPIEWRRSQLTALRAMVIDRSDEISQALWADLHKSRFETEVSECGLVRGEVDYALAHLAKWMRPRRVHVPLIGQLARGQIVFEPLGVVLIIGAWNYPVNVTLAPLVGALAGGNAAVIKPSELAPATSRVLARLVPEYLDAEAVEIVEGGHETTLDLLDERFDHIFFTGSTSTAHTIMEKAARDLTPVTLELGSKSPCLVDREADLTVAARRIVWGKFLNAGQTCVAPDYVLAHAAIEKELCTRMRESLREFYGANPQLSPDYGRIVDERHFDRLNSLLGDGEMFCGGAVDPLDKYIAPTILRHVSPDAPVMQEEIFGPILPVLTVPDLEAAIRFVNERPKPLVLYLFSTNRGIQQAVVEQTVSGNVCMNDVVMQLAVHELPFGGVGQSGMGRYHGRWSFETFTHPKGVFNKSFHLDLPLRYPPYSEAKSRWIARLS